MIWNTIVIVTPTHTATAAVKQAGRGDLGSIIVGKQSNQDGTQRAVDAMHTDRADRIIHLELLVDKFDTEYHGKARADADDRSAHRGDDITARGDCDQTGQRAVEHHRNIWLFVAHPGDAHDGDRRHCRGEVGGHEHAGGDLRAVARQRNCRAAVKAEPAEPQDEAAQRAERQRVARNRARLTVLGVFADAGPQDRRADQRAQAADKMHCRRTREIVETHFAQPAAALDPMAGYRVDDRRNHHRINAVGGKPGALRHSAGHDRRRGGAKHGLEHERRPVVALTDHAVRKKSIAPNRPFVVPNMMPKPTSQKIGVPRLKSIRFFMMMLPAFFARVKPVSTIANPPA